MSKSRKARKQAKKLALTGIYEKLGITHDILALHELALSEATETAFCPFSFTSDKEEVLLCMLDNGHEGNHESSSHTPEGYYKYSWPRVRPDRASEDYLRRMYAQYFVPENQIERLVL